MPRQRDRLCRCATLQLHFHDGWSEYAVPNYATAKRAEAIVNSQAKIRATFPEKRNDKYRT